MDELEKIDIQYQINQNPSEEILNNVSEALTIFKSKISVFPEIKVVFVKKI